MNEDSSQHKTFIQDIQINMVAEAHEKFMLTLAKEIERLLEQIKGGRNIICCNSNCLHRGTNKYCRDEKKKYYNCRLHKNKSEAVGVDARDICEKYSEKRKTEW